MNLRPNPCIYYQIPHTHIQPPPPFFIFDCIWHSTVCVRMYVLSCYMPHFRKQITMVCNPPQTLGPSHLLEYLGELSTSVGARVPTPQSVIRIITSKACRCACSPLLYCDALGANSDIAVTFRSSHLGRKLGDSRMDYSASAVASSHR